MLSYQHGYHAGNFADVLKHVALLRVMRYLTQKEKPLAYLETHAGRGMYDLHDSFAKKTNEARQGVELLWESRAQLPEVFSPYIQAISQCNASDANITDVLRYYPGSPWFAMKALRAMDRALCCELHPQEFTQLKRLPHQDVRAVFKQVDGFEALKAALPPAERRGLIFIDPSYEVKTDYQTVTKALQDAYQRFATGVYCLWYPIVDKRHHEQLLRGLKRVGAKDNCCVEFYLTKSTTAGMRGCGLWFINQPYVLDSELKFVLDTLCRVLNPGVATYKLFEIGPSLD